MPTPILLLDVMSTLVSEPFIEDVPRFLGLSLDELRAQRCHDAYLQFERGQIGEVEYGQRFFSSGEPLDLEGMKATLHRSVELLPGVPEVLDRCKAAGLPMYALSNYSEWYRVIDAKTGLSRWLDWSFVSCRTGYRKPEPEAYLGPCETLGVSPQSCVFVDDRASNVDAAERVGMRTILRAPETDLARELEALGVLPPT